MFLRQIEPRDYEKLKALHAKTGEPHDAPNFDGQNFIAGLVVVDEMDDPRMVLYFRRTAEAHVIVDHSFDSPGYRLLAIAELFQAARPLMEGMGYEDVHGIIGPEIPKSYVRRLQKMGCTLVNWTLMKMWKEEPK